MEPLSGAKIFLDHSRGVWGNASPENFENNVFRLAEIDFPGITFTRKFKMRHWLDLAGSHEISTHARETTKKSVSLMANPRGLATMTMYRYTKYWSVKNITESFTSFVLFFLYDLKS